MKTTLSQLKLTARTAEAGENLQVLATAQCGNCAKHVTEPGSNNERGIKK
jgi:hypothetical protein